MLASAPASTCSRSHVPERNDTRCDESRIGCFRWINMGLMRPPNFPADPVEETETARSDKAIGDAAFALGTIAALRDRRALASRFASALKSRAKPFGIFRGKSSQQLNRLASTVTNPAHQASITFERLPQANVFNDPRACSTCAIDPRSPWAGFFAGYELEVQRTPWLSQGGRAVLNGLMDRQMSRQIIEKSALLTKNPEPLEVDAAYNSALLTILEELAVKERNAENARWVAVAGLAKEQQRAFLWGRKNGSIQNWVIHQMLALPQLAEKTWTLADAAAGKVSTSEVNAVAALCRVQEQFGLSKSKTFQCQRHRHFAGFASRPTRTYALPPRPITSSRTRRGFSSVNP